MLDSDVKIRADEVIKVSPELVNKPFLLASTISFVYNIGVGAYEKSSVSADFKAGKYSDGCKAMLLYTYAGGKYSQGLANRRKAEYNICMKGVT
jgi:lysozyme